MDNAQIVTELRQRVGQTNLSDQTITSLFTPFLPADGNVNDEFYEKTTNLLKTLNGNFSHDVASQVSAQVDSKANEKFEQFKRDYKPDAPKTIEELLKIMGVEAQQTADAPKTIDELLKIIKGEKQQQNGGVSMSDVLEAIKAQQKQADPEMDTLKKQLAELLAENKRVKEEANFDAILKSVRENASKLQVNDEYEWKTAIELVTLRNSKEGMTEEKMLDLVKQEYAKRYKEKHPSEDSKPYGDGNGNGGYGGNYAAIKKMNEEKARIKQEAWKAQRENWK